MQRMRVRNILKEGKAGESVTVCGWVRSKRDSKNFAFVVVNDGSCQETLQLVVDEGTAAWSVLNKCNTGAAIRGKGLLRQSQGREQGIEMQCLELEVLGEIGRAHV